MEASKRPTYLYHYTTAEGLKGIVEKQELWASDIRFLNDWTEFYHGRDAFGRDLEKRLALMQNDTYEWRVAKIVSALLERPNPFASNPVFVCSFSTVGNDLTQWRAYCQDGGYAVGFPSGKLEALGAGNGFCLSPCQYSVEDSLGVVDVAIKALKHFFDEGKEDVGIRLAAGALAMFAASYKHPAFHAEGEWRLVHCLGELSLKFRKRGNSLIPYITCGLDDPDLWKDVHIIVGPSSREADELRVESVKMFLQSELTKRGLPTTCTDNVEASGIPYRTGMGG